MAAAAGAAMLRLMNTWTPQRGVLLHRPRLHGPTVRRLVPQEPPFPWILVPLLGLGFLVFFAALALMGEAWHPWQLGLMSLGLALVGGGIGMAARFFHRSL